MVVYHSFHTNVNIDNNTKYKQQIRMISEGSCGIEDWSNIYTVKRLIAINHIQNKSCCLHNICVCTVYIYYVYINTHVCTVSSTNIGTLGKYDQRQLWKKICIVYPFYLSFKKFTKFQPIIEVKQLKVGRGISLWNKCFHYFMLATIIGTQLLQRPFPSTTALRFLL